jgi:hypothetical protein
MENAQNAQTLLTKIQSLQNLETEMTSEEMMASLERLHEWIGNNLQEVRELLGGSKSHPTYSSFFLYIFDSE